MFGEYALGEFALGESRGSVTTAPSGAFDVRQTVISQYANSPVLLALIDSLAAAIDPSPEIDDFYRLLWNVDTAQGYGLDVWGRIVGVGRVVQLPSAGEFFGFDEATDADPFNQAIFFGGGGLTNNFALSDTAYRKVILAKALANICDGSIPAINQILINLFAGYGNCYVTDLGGMAMTYTFGSSLSPVDLAIVTQSGILPRPTGVAITIIQL